LIIIVFYLLLCCHLEDVLLCDNESIEELKELVKSDTSKYVDLMYEYAELKETTYQLETLAYVYDKLVSEEELDNGVSNEKLDNDKLDEARVVYDRIFLTKVRLKSKSLNLNIGVKS